MKLQKENIFSQVQQAIKKPNGLLAFIPHGLEFRSEEVLLEFCGCW